MLYINSSNTEICLDVSKVCASTLFLSVSFKVSTLMLTICDDIFSKICE